jgi:hypothetical protein
MPFTTRAIGKKGVFMTEDDEVAWHQEQIAKNHAILEGRRSGNASDSHVIPDTESEIGHLRFRIGSIRTDHCERNVLRLLTQRDRP